MSEKLTGKSEITINVPPAKVWEAITSPELIKQYFFGTNVITDWQPGHPVEFVGVWEGKEYRDKGTILENIPESSLSMTYWSSMSGKEDIPENYMTVRYALSPENDGTHLVVTQDNIDNRQTMEHSQQNWNIVLKALKDMLEG